MYAHTHIYIYIYISQHVDHPNINALCLGGGTRTIFNSNEEMCGNSKPFKQCNILTPLI